MGGRVNKLHYGLGENGDIRGITCAPIPLLSRLLFRAVTLVG